MSSKFTLNFTGGDSRTPVDTASKRNTLILLKNWARARLAGAHQGDDTVIAKTAQVTATGAVTCAAVQAADTFSVNGTAMTATQHYATGTVTAAAVAANDTVTIQSVVLTAKQQRALGTVTAATVSVDDTVTVNGSVFTAKASENTAAAQFNQASTDTAAAASLAACINASVDVLIAGIVTATASGAICTIRAVATGTGGNSITLATSNNSRLAKSNTTLTGAVAVAADQFDMSGTNTQTATALAAAANANATIAALITATSASAIVTLRSILVGTAGNAYTLATSNNSRLAKSSTTLTNGAAVGNNQFDYTGTDTQTGRYLAAAINASTTALVNKHVTAAAASGVVTLTASVPGYAGNAVTTASSNGSRLAITGSNARLTGGTETITTFTF